ncbi:MAG: efflux RND transporter periplasmic adaptor subunit [Paludibacteraceae bacterium]
MTRKGKIAMWMCIALAAAAVLCVVGAFVSERLGKPQVTYEQAVVARGNIHNAVTATGTVEPLTQVEVGTQVSGIVDKIFVDYNSPVKKGQIIAVLDKSTLESELASARANVNMCQVEMEYQQKEYERIKVLADKGMVSDSDYDLAYYNYHRAKSSYDVAKQNLTKAQTNLGYATIYSPIDGVVLSKSVEEGQTVASSFSTPTLFVIAEDLTQMRVVADVDEADIGEVRDGQRVQFTVDAYPSLTFEGTVQQVRQEATTTSSVVTYEVVISARNPDLKLKPGMTATATIYTLERNNVLLVPSKALKFTPICQGIDTLLDCEATHKVWSREGHRFVALPVEVGVATGSQTEIVSGLHEGQVILVGTADGQLQGQTQMDENTEASAGERSPFMPGRPGERKK